MTVVLPGIDELRRLRRSPFVDYVEPAAAPLATQSTGLLGCDNTLYSSTGRPEPKRSATGDYIPWNYGFHDIERAWRRSKGAGVTVAWVDTGLFAEQSQLRTDESSGRTIRHLWTLGTTAYTDCSHGTRMGATAIAPADRDGIAGVAHAADGISMRSMDGSLQLFDTGVVAAGIWNAAEAGANVIIMAFGSASELVLMGDTIRFSMWRHPRLLFVAAAGTNPVGISAVQTVVFPARMEEVIAVAGSDLHDLASPHVTSFFGAEVDVSAVIDWHVPTSGKFPTDVIDFGGTSNASAMIGGIVALIWSKYPNWNRDQVRERLFASGFPAKSSKVGWGVINAFAAVGGLTRVRVEGPSNASGGLGTTYTLTAQPNGDGPHSYRWDSGETTPSITKRITRCTAFSRVHTVTVTDQSDGTQAGATHRLTYEGCPTD